MEQQTIERRIRERLTGQHFMHHIGFNLVQIDAGYIVGEMPLQGFSFQQLGFVHGGITATVADIVAGFAAYTLTPIDKHVVTGELKISYFRPGKGDFLKAIGRVVKAGKTLHFCEAEVWVGNASEKEKLVLIAKATTTMVVIE